MYRLSAAITFVALPTITHGWAPFSTPRHRGGCKPSTTALGGTSRRDALAIVSSFAVGFGSSSPSNAIIEDLLLENEKQQYTLKFPTLFAPLYGDASRSTIKRSLGRTDGNNGNIENDNIWAMEQNLELGPLQTPLRCTVVRLRDGTLWIHAPLAPTEEFFELVESCGGSDGGTGGGGRVAHVVVPTYALEHKVFVKDCMARWPDAELWTSPGQFSFPFRVSDEFAFGKRVAGVLGDCYRNCNVDDAAVIPPWSDEIEYATLSGGTFDIGGNPTTLYETAFFHKASKTLIVTDAVARIPTSVPPLNDPQKLLLISKRTTSDAMPEDTPQARLAGWKKTALLVSYFFPQHEEPDPDTLGVVTWTDGWEDNFDALAGRLIVPPVVRTLIYSQNPRGVRRWVDVVARESGWDFDRIVPAHFEAPIGAGPREFELAFRFLEDSSIDSFPEEDLRRGLRPIADVISRQL